MWIGASRANRRAAGGRPPPGRALVSVFAASLLLALTAAPAAAQSTTLERADEAPSLSITPTVVARPQASAAPAELHPGDVPVATGSGELAKPAQQAESIRSGDGSAQLQTPASKRQEVRAACNPEAVPLRTSSMLGLPGSIGGDDGADWGPLLLVVAGASGVLALVAWRRRSRRDRPEPRDPLETASTIIALISAVIGLALTFVPGLAAEAPRPPSAEMRIRMAHANITHGEYATKIGTRERLSKDDRREVGNVIWLQLRLEGFRDKPLRVQYGAYDAPIGGALLPGTTREIVLPSDRADVETTFVPIWVGRPRQTTDRKKFRAQFRLIDPAGQILEMARTDEMQASPVRYAC